jgi:hypothetical protein
MILKVELSQPIFDNYKREPQTSKDGVKKKNTNSFASVLENTIKSKSTGS